MPFWERREIIPIQNCALYLSHRNFRWDHFSIYFLLKKNGWFSAHTCYPQILCPLQMRKDNILVLNYLIFSSIVIPIEFLISTHGISPDIPIYNTLCSEVSNWVFLYYVLLRFYFFYPMLSLISMNFLQGYYLFPYKWYPTQVTGKGLFSIWTASSTKLGSATNSCYVSFYLVTFIGGVTNNPPPPSIHTFNW